jgi:hypothetical protein
MGTIDGGKIFVSEGGTMSGGGGGMSGGKLAAGTCTTPAHVGHCTCCPTRSESTSNKPEQNGQLNCIADITEFLKLRCA